MKEPEEERKALRVTIIAARDELARSERARHLLVERLADAHERLHEREASFESMRDELATLRRELAEARRDARDEYVAADAVAQAYARLNERLSNQLVSVAEDRTKLVDTERKLTYRVEDLEMQLAALAAQRESGD